MTTTRAGGSLTVVGTGFSVAGQIHASAAAEIRLADKLFYVVGDGPTRQWLQAQNTTAESLDDAYQAGKPRRRTYAEMVARMLEPVRRGQRVCAAFYGHPGVFVSPSHSAIAQARDEGYTATMLPAVSAEDCLFADLEIDPTTDGCQSFEATAFLIYRRRFDPHAALILWQVGAVGVTTFEHQRLWSRRGLEILTEELLRAYPAAHVCTLYEAADIPLCEPRIERLALGDLAQADVTTISTLYIPPRGKAAIDPVMQGRVAAARR